MKTLKFSVIFILVSFNLTYAEEILSQKEQRSLLLETAKEIIQNQVFKDEPILVELRDTCIKELKLPETLADLNREQKLALAKKFIIGYIDIVITNLNDEDREQLDRLKKEVLGLPDSIPLSGLSENQKIHLYKAIWDDVNKQIQAVITGNEQIREETRK